MSPCLDAHNISRTSGHINAFPFTFAGTLIDADEVRVVVGADGKGVGEFHVVCVEDRPAPSAESDLRVASLDMDEVWSALGY